MSGVDSAEWLSVGDVIGQSFEIVEWAGEGHYARLYKARQLNSGSIVAVKTIRPEHAGRVGYESRFRDEQRVLADFSHRHLCSVIDSGKHSLGQSDCLWLAMKWIEGRTLAEEVAANGPLSESRAALLIAQAAEALDAVWGALHLVHRDVTPRNLMISRREEAVLIDFGVAKRVDVISPSPSLGSRLKQGPWAAPESIGEGHRSDVYSLGLVLAFAVTGASPTPDHRPGLPGNIKVSRGLRRAIREATDPDPTSGLSARELALKLRALTRESGTAPASGARTPAWEPPVRPRRGRRRRENGKAPLDSPQPSVAEEPKSTWPSLTAVACGVAVAMAGIGGWLAGGSEGGDTGYRSAPAGPVTLTYPGEWRRSAPTPTEVGNAWLDPEVTLHRRGDPRASMTAGMLRTAADGGPLPGPPRGLGTPARIQVGSLLALRYPPRTSDGGWRRSVVVLPTESGFVALACRAPVAIAASAAASCRALLARLRADAGAAESWRAGSGYMRFLQSDVNLSEALRLGEERGFGAKSLDARAQAASKIATGYRVLGDDLAERQPPPAERVAAKRLEAASRSSSRAFRRMARAARDRDRASYAAALDAVRASSAARLAALRDFRLAGYRVDIRRESPCAECGS